MDAPAKILPCEVCKYDLNGLGTGTYVVCPECGLKQPRRTSLSPWPTGLASFAWASGVTLVLCNLCLILLLAMFVVGGAVVGPLLFLAAATFLSGPIVPIVAAIKLARRHDRLSIHSFIPIGWLLNCLIGAIYLGIAIGVGILGSI